MEQGHSNLAHSDKPVLTRTAADPNVVDLQARLGESLDQLATLDGAESNDADSARSIWNWIFKSADFFADFDAARKKRRNGTDCWLKPRWSARERERHRTE